MKSVPKKTKEKGPSSCKALYLKDNLVKEIEKIAKETMNQEWYKNLFSDEYLIEDDSNYNIKILEYKKNMVIKINCMVILICN